MRSIMRSIKSLQPTRDGVLSSVPRFTALDLAWLSWTFSDEVVVNCAP
jgi:hypothetical protein